MRGPAFGFSGVHRVTSQKWRFTTRRSHPNHYAAERTEPEGIQLYPYFSTSAYSGYGDGDGGFFRTYAAVFAELDDEERAIAATRPDRKSAGSAAAPRIGTSSSAWLEVKRFYDHWESFRTVRTCEAAIRHHESALRKASSKQRKAMEAENAKLKKLLAETMLDNAALKDVVSKKW